MLRTLPPSDTTDTTIRTLEHDIRRDNLCTGGDTPGHWIPSEAGATILPGVPFGMSEGEGQGTTFFDNRGSLFCNQETTPTYQSLDLMRHVYVSDSGCGYRIFDTAMAKRCLRTRWIHIEGTALSVDLFYDLADVLNGTYPCPRFKHGTYSVTLDGGTRLTYASPHETEADMCLPTWTSYATPERPAPDVWLASPGTMMQNKDRGFLKKRLACLRTIHRQVQGAAAAAAAAGAAAGAGGGGGGGAAAANDGMPQRAIFRTISGARDVGVGASLPLGLERALRDVKVFNDESAGLDPRQGLFQWVGDEAARTLKPDGWGILDARSIVKARLNEPQFQSSADGFTLTGVGSRWVTNVFLNQLCNE